MGILGIIFGILGIFFVGLIFIPLGLLCTVFSLLSGRITVGIVSLCVNIMAIIVSPSAWLAILGLFSVASNPSHQGLDNNKQQAKVEILKPVQAIIGKDYSVADMQPIEQNADTPKSQDNKPSQKGDTKLSKYKAKDELEEANRQINIVWKAITKDVRLAILPEQREWLKKREGDCSLKASLKEPDNSVAQNTIKLGCMTAMTLERTEVLKQKIANLQQPNSMQPQSKNGLHYSEEELFDLAENGNSNAMYALGYRYLNGIGELPKNPKIAMEWFKKSADAGNRRAIEILK